MPRNGSSVYSLPAGNPVIPGTIIATTWANTTLTDIATALTNSLSTDGSTASVSLAGKTMAGGIFNGPAVTGILTLTGGQIKFPAVAIPSADANTLDDYEEGTWTPTITFATPGNLNVVYSTRLGVYTKIGDVCQLNLRAATSTFTHTTASGNLQVSGMPFASNATANLVQNLSPGYLAGINIGTGATFLEGIIIDPGVSFMRFALTDFTAKTVVSLVTTNCVSGTTNDFVISGVYKTS